MEDLQQILNEQKPKLLSVNDQKSETDKDDVMDLMKSRLAAVTAGGNSKLYLGKLYTVEDIEKMKRDDIIKLYARYEAKLGQTITKSLGSSFISLYVMLVKCEFELNDENNLIKDLEEDPFINNALNSKLCDLYYTFGNYLAPIAAGVITTTHIKSK